jgi:hypothetical protein
MKGPADGWRSSGRLPIPSNHGSAKSPREYQQKPRICCATSATRIDSQFTFMCAE